MAIRGFLTRFRREGPVRNSEAGRSLPLTRVRLKEHSVIGRGDRIGNAAEGPQERSITDVGPMAKQRVETEILTRAEAVPSPPDILSILQEKANEDHVDMSEIEVLLRQDPALVAKLLRLVNSSFFALRYKVNNISHALVLVGYQTLRSLIFAAFADELYRQEMRGYGYARRGLWRHCVRCAFTARMLALRGVVERAFAEDLFVAGLLHDLGKILLWPTIRDRQGEFDRALEAGAGDLLSGERLVCGIDHAEAGALVARRWGLADNLIEAISCHHVPEAAVDYPKQVAAVHLVNWVLGELRVGLLPGRAHHEHLAPSAVDRLALDPGAIEDLKCWLAQTGEHAPVAD